ncbi:hypothetical protein HGRIS_000044 [Hohenbuehelia grisea]|uniref:Uncharacterized protein n=1 Tax=Hohenbuehelia grisea TaxID=104357 RepID=A0ABR3JPW2_9AGAR
MQLFGSFSLAAFDAAYFMRLTVSSPTGAVPRADDPPLMEQSDTETDYYCWCYKGPGLASNATETGPSAFTTTGQFYTSETCEGVLAEPFCNYWCKMDDLLHAAMFMAHCKLIYDNEPEYSTSHCFKWNATEAACEADI